MDDEMRFHVEARAADLVREGVSPEEAMRRARLEFGGFETAKEDCRRAVGLGLLADLAQDLRFAARSLLRTPVFAASAIVTLALGIGATTAIFSLIDEALLRPLPLPRPAELAAIYQFDRKAGTYVSSSFPDWEDLRQRSQSFADIAGYARMPFNVMLDGHAERVPFEAVTTNYFQTLDLAPLIGRVFRKEDEHAAVAPVMIGENFWRSHFRGDPAAIGQMLAVEDQRLEIVGVVPAKYRGANLAWSGLPEAWVPLTATPVLIPRLRSINLLGQRAGRWLVLIGRLRPESTVRAAQAELGAVAAQMGRDYASTNRDITVAVFPAGNAKFWPAYRASVSQWFAVFGGAAGLVLLLACANVSNLLLERASGRRREIAVRLAIGASRGRLVRQLITENLLLAVPGFGLAVWVAYELAKLLAQFPSALGFVIALHASIEPRVLLLCAVLTIGSAALFGLAPALQATRPDLGRSAGREWMRRGLVVAQVAFCTILLVAGGLFGRTLGKAYGADLGFDRTHMLIVQFNLPAGAAMTDRGRHMLIEELQRIGSLPGVVAASVMDRPPLGMQRRVAQASDSSDPAGAPITVEYSSVGPDYLKAAGISLIAGRDFTARDDGGSRVAIVNQTFATRLWRGTSAVGRTFSLQATRYQVVGVARDAKTKTVWDAAEPFVYIPETGLSQHLAVRTSVPPELVIPAIRREWAVVAPQAPIVDIRTGEAVLQDAIAPQRMAAALLGSFGLLAIVLAATGLYGVMAYAVSQRTREIGVRIAVGARPGDVVRDVLARALTMAVAGLIAGAAASAALGRLIASQVKDVSPYDAVTFGVVALLLTAVSVAAALVPAVRAARIDPLAALRCE